MPSHAIQRWQRNYYSCFTVDIRHKRNSLTDCPPCSAFCASPISWIYPGTHKIIILTSKKTPEQIWLVRAFLCRSNHREGPFFPVIFTRRRPVSPPGHGLIDFYFHSIFPWSSLEQNFKKDEEKKNTRLLSPRGSTKVCREGPKRSSFLGLPKGQNNKCRLNWGSPRRQRGQNATLWQHRPS